MVVAPFHWHPETAIVVEYRGYNLRISIADFRLPVSLTLTRR